MSLQVSHPEDKLVSMKQYHHDDTTLFFLSEEQNVSVCCHDNKILFCFLVLNVAELDLLFSYIHKKKHLNSLPALPPHKYTESFLDSLFYL